MRRVELVHFDAGILHAFDQLIVHLRAAHPVEQHMHLHAVACAFGQRIGERAADLARPVDVGLEGDGDSCAADGGQHRREDLIAIEQCRHPVAVEKRGPEQHTELAREGRIAQRMHALDAPLDLGFATASGVDDEQADGKRHQQHATQPERPVLCHGICDRGEMIASCPSRLCVCVSRRGRRDLLVGAHLAMAVSIR
jgi:hypothetical protein